MQVAQMEDTSEPYPRLEPSRDASSMQAAAASEPASISGGHRCPRCRKRFSTAAHARRHIAAVHEKQRPHRCRQCEHAFSLRENLTRHVRAVHDGVVQPKRHRCERCNVAFAGLAKLKLHTKSVHDLQKQHACALCDKSYWRQAHLDSHVAKMHQGGTTLPPEGEQKLAAVDRSAVRLEPKRDDVFLEQTTVHSLVHSTSPAAWERISAERHVRGSTPDDQRYDGLDLGMPRARDDHVQAPVSDQPLTFAYFLASTSDPALFPFSRYPKKLPDKSEVKLALLSPKFLRDGANWALFYIASTPTQFGGGFKTVYSSHVTAVRRDTAEFRLACARGWTQLDLSNSRNKLLSFSAAGELRTASRVLVSGTTYKHSVMVSFLGGLKYSEQGKHIRAIDGFKFGFAKGLVACPVPRCDVRCNSVPNLRVHYHATHLKLQPHSCPQCRKLFSLEKNLTVHVATVHGGERSHACPRCEQTFTQRSSLNLHVATVHERQKSHVCPRLQCGRAFTQRAHLTRHIADVHDGAKNHRCPDCDKRFSQKGDMEKHVAAVHRKQKLHRCATCGKQFAQKAHLAVHVQGVHQGVRHHVCSHAQCNKAFSTASNLRKHVATVHGGAKAHACPEPGCSRRFVTRNHVEVHRASVHRGEKHLCTRCQRQFATKSSLKRHEKRAHKT